MNHLGDFSGVTDRAPEHLYRDFHVALQSTVYDPHTAICYFVIAWAWGSFVRG